MSQQGSTEIQFTIHGLMQPILQVLRDNLAQDYLLCEILRTYRDMVLRRAAREK
jgi:hypothetical protein